MLSIIALGPPRRGDRMADNIRDKIWFTAHIRMRSEARLRSNSTRLNILIFWFSTALTCLTVYQLTAPKSVNRDVISAVLAICVFGLSIFIPTFGLERQADKYRECYLKLQRLLETESDDVKITPLYHDILEAYPNHPSHDYVDFVVDSYLRNQNLRSGGDPVTPSWAMIAGYCYRTVSRQLFIIVAAGSPGLLYFLL